MCIRDRRRFGHIRRLDRRPDRRQTQQLLRRKEGRCYIGQPDAFFLGQFERMDKAQPVHQPVGNPRGQNLATQAVAQNILAVGLAHLQREAGQQIAFQPLSLIHT